MDLQHTYTVAEVLEIINTLPDKDKEIVKNILSLSDQTIEQMVKEDFIKYEATFRALA